MPDQQFEYEMLTNSQFQALVSALVVREHPRTQCMPLSGRDGGRDAVVQTVQADGKLVDSLIFQVKMRMKSVTGIPTEEDLYQWVAAQLRRERPKVARLAKRGAHEFIFVCNLPASGDLEGGLRDRVQELLNRQFSITASAWWREDIDTRLRAYPEIAASHGFIVGSEAIRHLLSRIGSIDRTLGPLNASDVDLAVRAVASYCADQYRDDRFMRFSQVDLDPIHLLNLFIDVPLQRLRNNDAGSSMTRESRAWATMIAEIAEMQQEHDSARGRLQKPPERRSRMENVGAADLILLSGSSLFLRCVIEGAPGQGKSTASQYICQVHRARILDCTEDLVRLDPLHRYSAVRVPFRVELRRYGAWLLEGGSEAERGIIRYVAEAVSKASELLFTANNLASVLCGTPSIFMLDGLDEVADVETRDLVIEQIVKLGDNLRAWRADAQLIVTSRPSTAIAGKVFPESEFQQYNLGNLSRHQIFSYAHAWMDLKKLPAEKRDEIQDVLTVSLDSAHVADLARNPMQLAILLYLVHKRGRSLPEKRTALYHSYIETFQMRESDKSLPVSEYGDLLLDLHAYIAWLLHARSELGRSDGAQGDIARSDLISILANYLDYEGYDRDLAAQIFTGVQRFFVLVERVEGRFEFEVQPLREYFAARYLYTTSPQTPTVEEPSGTRPDRLEALLDNPYWFNVLRFYAGNYQKGELADLARSLSDMMTGSAWRGTSRPYEVMERVLQDYSMSQSRRDTRDVAGLLASGIGARLISRGFSSRQAGYTQTVSFTDDIGRKEIVHVSRELLLLGCATEVAQELARTLASNDPDVGEWWTERWLNCPQMSE